MSPSRADFAAAESGGVLRAAVERLAEGFEGLPPSGAGVPGGAEIARVLEEAATRLQNNYPYFHPLYAGQMLKPPHPVARLAYALAMWLNPNNHALDGGRESSKMEKEAVAAIAGMFGWKEHLGHLCGGGTMANLEALWVARQLRPGATVVASSQAHYTHGRIGAVLGLPFETIPSDRRGRMDAGALARRLERGGVGTVVATIGTTATGSVDPLPEILELRDRHGFRLHADAAYGGYFGLAENLDGRGTADVRPPGRGGLDRDRPAQARAPAVRLRLRALPRSGRRPLLQARLAVHVLQLGGAAPGRDQPRVLARRAQPRSPCGRPSGSCRSKPEATSRPASPTAGPPHSRSNRRCLPTLASFRRFRRSSTSSSGSRGHRAQPPRRSARAGSSRKPRDATSTSRSPSCRPTSSIWTRPASPGTAIG